MPCRVDPGGLKGDVIEACSQSSLSQPITRPDLPLQLSTGSPGPSKSNCSLGLLTTSLGGGRPGSFCVPSGCSVRALSQASATLGTFGSNAKETAEWLDRQEEKGFCPLHHRNEEGPFGIATTGPLAFLVLK